MQYVNDININEAIIHILDNNAVEPILNNYKLELEEDTYKFLYKHIEKCLNDEELKYAKFSYERNVVKEIAQDYLNGTDSDFISISKELARQLFSIMKGNVNIPSCDLIITSIITDQGPMIAILKMDYVNNFTHEVEFIDGEIGVKLVSQLAGLPRSGHKIQKAAFIKPVRESDSFNLYVLDRQGKRQGEDEYGANYFMNNFLGCEVVVNDRDNTKRFLNATESFVRRYISEDAYLAEKVRSLTREALQNDENINIREVSEKLFNGNEEFKDSYNVFMAGNCEEEFRVDERYVDKKLKRIRLKIDKDIDLYITEESYKDPSKFEIKRNGDGSIDMIIKHVINYIQK